MQFLEIFPSFLYDLKIYKRVQQQTTKKPQDLVPSLHPPLQPLLKVHLLPVGVHVCVRVERPRAVRTRVQPFAITSVVRAHVLAQADGLRERLLANGTAELPRPMHEPLVTSERDPVRGLLATYLAADRLARLVHHQPVLAQAPLGERPVAVRTLDAARLRGVRIVRGSGVRFELLPRDEPFGADFADVVEL